MKKIEPFFSYLMYLYQTNNNDNELWALWNKDKYKGMEPSL